MQTNDGAQQGGGGHQFGLYHDHHYPPPRRTQCAIKLLMTKQNFELIFIWERELKEKAEAEE